MKNINLSAWALEHPSFVLFLMILTMVGGVLSYFQLGRSEDPDFTFKAAVVRTLWPGATAAETEQQVTERIEKKLQEVAAVDVIRSTTRPGESLIFVILKDNASRQDVAEAWRQMRRKLDDIKPQLPQGTQGPFPNDEFGDTFVNIFALTGDGFDNAALRRLADSMAKDLRLVPDVKRVELVGVQDEKIYIDMPPARMAALGLSVPLLADALQKQNAVSASGFLETDADRIRLRVSGALDGVEKIRALDLAVAGKHVRLGDIAKVYRGYADPPQARMRVNGEPAVGLAVVMARGGDVMRLGKNLRAEVDRLHAQLPRGVEVHVVADQPEVVRTSIDLFVESLAVAVVIVLAVSFLSLGGRAGSVVALSIPLVLAATFIGMRFIGVDLHRISLGALVIALGLLVDDAIIAVEMMVVKMEQGWDRFKAGTFAYTSTAFPMLTGTLITAAGFTPVGLARSTAGEYAGSIYYVVCLALVISWFVAVVFTPYLGFKLLDPAKLVAYGREHQGNIYNTPFYRSFRRLVEWCVRRRWLTIGTTAAIFALAMVVFLTGVQKQFFPASSRTELVVQLWLPQGASLKATEQMTRQVEGILAKESGIRRTATYIGNGSPRFYLPLDQQLFSDNFSEIIVETEDLAAREGLRQRMIDRFADPKSGFTGLRTRVLRLENGPPVGFPVLFRVMGDDFEKLRDIARQVAAAMQANPELAEANLDWNEKVKALRFEIDQDRARSLGVSSQDVAQALQGWYVGTTLSQYREKDQLIDVVWRGDGAARAALNGVPEVPVPAAGGRTVPLAQVARAVPVLEEGFIARRNRLATIQVRADILTETQAPVLSEQIWKDLAQVRAQLPPGYRIEIGGAIEEAQKGESSIMAVMPFMVALVLTLLMMQLHSMRLTLLVLLTAPLGFIGVTAALIVFRAPYGFVANLGVIALMGMIMRNSVILVDQIRQDEQAGRTPWDAIIGSTVRRFRPIVLTAAAAVLAMIPLTRQVFWGPMAVAIMGGLMVATALTCLFLPALYAAWFGVKEE